MTIPSQKFYWCVSHMKNTKPVFLKNVMSYSKEMALTGFYLLNIRALQSSPWKMQFAITLCMTLRTARYNPIWRQCKWFPIKQKEEEGSLGNRENPAYKICYIFPSRQFSLASKPAEIFISSAVCTHIKTLKHFPFNCPRLYYAGNFYISIFYIYFYFFVV